MNPAIPPCPVHVDPRRRDHFSAISHLVGAALSVIALLVLVILAAERATAWHVVGFSVFGASLILMYLASSFYHLAPNPSKVRRVLRRLDHIMIYVQIAGTYTPVCLTVLRGGWGWSLLGVVWAIALWGIIVKGAWLKIPRVVSTLSYLIMGWLIVIAIYPLAKAVPAGGLWWMAGAGFFYSTGVIFYTLDKKFPSSGWFNFHDVFHLFILGGSFCFFWMMFRYLLPPG
ncbi:MAG: hemolysin III family protein [Spirochaetes bacterium]|nr:hemolysin III family protein [Spirochaetota bacterium]